MIFKCVFGNYELRHEWLEGVHTVCFWNTQHPLWCVLWTERMKQVCKYASFDTLLLNCGPLKREVLCECLIISALHWPHHKTLPYDSQKWVAQYAVWCVMRQCCSASSFILWDAFVEMADMHIMFSCAYGSEFPAQDLYLYTLPGL